ncbi:TetR/AcrR family transcriptional regulator [Fodinicola feengrottensis]|uniref:TetR/AcrR family transcriptional regulator n=1 Tax=Fodinicola feengrottensis TaxID=435914 RepID=A0ABP4SM11_9ACTN
MNASQTARERARIELTREIKEEARRQLAADGADRLSLRGVARELGLVSSALYRYFPSRDDLLTALIIDAYNAIGEAAETVPDGPAGSAQRWRAVCRAIRRWAREHSGEYALIYGSAIPGYQAPPETIAPAGRGAFVLFAVLRDAWAAGRLVVPADAPAMSSRLSGQFGQLSVVAPELPDAVLARAVIVWTQLFGMISFELTGQFVGTVDPTDEFFEHATAEMAAFLGLADSFGGGRTVPG